MLSSIKIRPVQRKDFDQIWQIFKKIIARGDSYVNDDSTTKINAREKWMGKGIRTFVARACLQTNCLESQAILPEFRATISEKYTTIPRKFSEESQAKEPRSEASKASESFSLETDSKINGKIVGAYLLKPNQVGRGSHIANASYIVDENCRGAGVGKALALHSIAKAKESGYLAMQFNFVVSTNTAAVNLWQSVGFEIIGTIPKAFKHQALGYVDAYVMFMDL